jgi:integrase
MPRVPKPYVFRGWYVTGAGGKRTKLCEESAGFEEAQRRLDALLGLDRTAGTDVLTVGQFCDRYMEFARIYYRKGGEPTSEVEQFGVTFSYLKADFAGLPVTSFGKAELKTFRARMLAAGISRKVLNRRVGMVRRAIRWGCEEDLIPETVLASLMVVGSLAKGRSEARELPPIPPVPVEDVDATLKKLHPPVTFMVRLQTLTGMRPGEVCSLHVDQIDLDRGIVDLEGTHKTDHKGKGRRVILGPRALELVRDLVEGARAANGYLFRPGVSRFSTSKLPFYRRKSYERAIKVACGRAGVEPWAPNRLRHTFATMVRAALGVEAAQVALGHAKADVTQIYAERDERLQRAVAERFG